jgi:hypothetical protein
MKVYYILINAVTINEAKDSSTIENIVTTHNDICKVLTEENNVIHNVLTEAKFMKEIMKLKSFSEK